MRVTPPVTITDAKLTSSGASEPHAPAAYAGGTTYAFGDIVSVAADFTIYESLAAGNIGHAPASSPTWWRILGATETAYNAGTTYGLGDTVSSATTHRCYESLQAANVGKPLPVPPETATAWWIDVGPTNKWAMFDLASNTQTVRASPLTVVVTPGERVNTVRFAGLSANSLVLSATSVNGGGIVYPLPYDAAKTYKKNDCMTVGLTTCYQSKADGNVGHAAPDATWWTVVSGAVFDLNTRKVNDGYDYCFEPFSTRPSSGAFDLPPYSDIIITATISATSGNVKCGAMGVGTYIYIGAVNYRAKADSLNFSTVTRDLWGNATLVPRRGVPKTSQTLDLPKARVNKVMDAKQLLDARPAFWTGLDDATDDWFEMVQVLGIWKQFEFDMALPNTAKVTLELEGI